MPPKVLVTITSATATTLGPGNTSIDDRDSQVVTQGQL